MNGLDQTIPYADLLKDGELAPGVREIFYSWYDTYSTDGKMTKEDCARFVSVVTNSRDDIPPDDSRVSGLFAVHDPQNKGFIEREGFVSFFVDSTLNPNKKAVVWENLKNMGTRNDLKRLDEPYQTYNTDKTVLPRYRLAHNEEFFDTLFYLQDLDDKIAKEAFDFLCLITTNPLIYEQILQGSDGRTNSTWENLLDAKNIYKLIYSLQVIESFLEDVEIDSTNIDSFNEDQSIMMNDTDPEQMRFKKLEWMRNFVTKGGFSHLAKILQLKFNELLSSESQEGVMNKICIQFLLKIIRIFYFSSLKANERGHVSPSEHETVTSEGEAPSLGLESKFFLIILFFRTKIFSNRFLYFRNFVRRGTR